MRLILELYSLLPLTVDNLMKLEPQPFQRHDHEYLCSLDLKSILGGMKGCCAARGDTVISASGILRIWTGRWQGWSVYSVRATVRDFVYIRNQTRLFLDGVDANRIEITVLLDFVGGHSYARSLGFTAEGVMRKYDMLGRDHVLYSRVSNGS